MQAAILTLQLDERSFAEMTALRTRHFPPERNYLSAHVTLFHALPFDADLDGPIAEVAGAFTPFALTFSRPYFMGGGTAIAVESAPLMALRARLADRFSARLSSQDRSGFKPHVTIQNKVPSRVAKTFYTEFSRDWQPRGGRGEGLDLWLYEGGPWRHWRTYAFTSSSATWTSPS